MQRKEKELCCLNNTVDWSLNKRMLGSLLGRADWNGLGVGFENFNSKDCNLILKCGNLGHEACCEVKSMGGSTVQIMEINGDGSREGNKENERPGKVSGTRPFKRILRKEKGLCFKDSLIEKGGLGISVGDKRNSLDILEEDQGVAKRSSVGLQDEIFESIGQIENYKGEDLVPLSRFLSNSGSKGEGYGNGRRGLRGNPES